MQGKSASGSCCDQRTGGSRSTSKISDRRKDNGHQEVAVACEALYRVSANSHSGWGPASWVALPFALARGRSSEFSIVPRWWRSSLPGSIATSATPEGCLAGAAYALAPFNICNPAANAEARARAHGAPRPNSARSAHFLPDGVDTGRIDSAIIPVGFSRTT